jgi:hypothetical protein
MRRAARMLGTKSRLEDVSIRGKSLAELLTPRTEKGKKQEAVRGVFLKGSYAPVTRVIHAPVKGKITERQFELIDPLDAIQFPKVDKENRISVAGEERCFPPEKNQPMFIGLCFRNFGYESLLEWVKALEEKNVKDLDVIYVAEGNPFFRAVTKWLAWRNLEKNLSQEEKLRTILHRNDFYDQAFDLNVDNVLTSYIYLLDANGKVRWSATGIPSCVQEVDDAVRFLEALNKEKEGKIIQSPKNDSDTIKAAQAALGK